MFQPLNPQLYHALQRRFGTVEIANKGEPIQYAAGLNGRLELIQRGEQYRVSCPWCNDTRQRLYINHRWGVRDGNGHINLHLIHCFNESCDSCEFRRKQLHSDCYCGLTVTTNDLPSPKPYIPPPPPVWPPPGTVPADALPDADWAGGYLMSRGYSETEMHELVERYDLRVLDRQRNAYDITNRDMDVCVVNRIITPVKHEQQVVGYQARAACWLPSDSERPKYMNSHYCKSHYLYGYDDAQDSDLVVVVEGPFDVWSVGPGAVGLFGKTISNHQALLLKRWSHIVLMLDHDVFINSHELAEVDAAA